MSAAAFQPVARICFTGAVPPPRCPADGAFTPHLHVHFVGDVAELPEETGENPIMADDIGDVPGDRIDELHLPEFAVCRVLVPNLAFDRFDGDVGHASSPVGVPAATVADGEVAANPSPDGADEQTDSAEVPHA